MSGQTKIEWCDRVWNPTTGCSRVSSGCDNCYAIRMARRHDGRLPEYAGTTRRSKRGLDWTGVVHLNEHRLEDPFSWREPQKVFVDSMSDLFHPSVPFEFIDKVFAVMGLTPRHTYQVLTKRPERMAEYVRGLGPEPEERLSQAAFDAQLGEDADVWLSNYLTGWSNPQERPDDVKPGERRWPLPNVWLGTSVEHQEAADERIPHLMRTPAAVRFLSCEPLLGPVHLKTGRYNALGGTAVYRRGQHNAAGEWDEGDYWMVAGAIHWVIVGGESGPKARPMHPDWARSLRDQCVEEDVPFHFKQWGEWTARLPQHTNLSYRAETYEHGEHFYRVGKKAAGRELDGRTWDQAPTVAS